MMTKLVLAAVSLYLATEGFSLLTAPPSLVRVALAKADQPQREPSATNANGRNA